jgi:conjugative transfer pilus assembly protein TraH
MLRLTKISLVFTLLYAAPAYSVVKDFEQQIKKMGFVSNVTKPDVIKDQQAGFMTGGSMTIRGNVSNTQLAWLQLPSLKAGCGGIDLFGGGFGYINSAQITSLIKNIAQNASAYATYLAIDQLSPEMGNINKGLEAAARFINSQNINSCQMAASMVAGAFPKTEQSERLACQARNMGSNAVSDFFTSRYKCSSDEVSKTNKEKKGTYDLDTLLGTEYNLVWKALKDKGINDKTTISLLMSISGTYISRLNGGRIVSDFKPSLATRSELIEAVMHGEDTTPLYSCKDSECLVVETVKSRITQEVSLVGKIESLIESIAYKIRSETAGNFEKLTPEEENLIRMSAFPIIPMIKTEIVRKSGNVSLSINEYVEAISFDVAINYLEEMLGLVYAAVLELENAQFDGSKIESFRREMRQVRKHLQNYKQVGMNRTKIIQDVKRRTELLEKQIRINFQDYIG